jgi:hypothetical protein
MGLKIYLCLLGHSFGKSSANPRQARLANYVGLSIRQVRTYLHELQTAGWLTIKLHGKNNPASYELHHRWQR